MKKSLFVLGTALLFTTSALASNWGYAAGEYDPPCSTCQNRVAYQANTAYQQNGYYQQNNSYQQNGYYQQNNSYQQNGYYQQNNSYQPYGTYQGSVVNQAQTQNAQPSPVYRKPSETNKNNSPYRIGNPLYHPTKGQTLLGMGVSYWYEPKEKKVGQEEVKGWIFSPGTEYGITDKLSLFAGGNYARYKVKSGANKGAKEDTYDASAGLRYLLVSVEGFDVNAKAGLYYIKDRYKHHNVIGRRTGTDVALQIGKKIQNITPYFTVGFQTDFWSKRYSGSGTDTYINPGVYIDLTKNLSLNLDYVSYEHGDATYRATLDIYPTNVGVISLGGFIIHPETDRDTYGATAAVKVAF